MTLGGGKRRRSKRSKRSKRPSKRRNSKSKRGKKRRRKRGGAMKYAASAAAGLTGMGAARLGAYGVGHAMGKNLGVDTLKNVVMPPMSIKEFTLFARKHPILLAITAIFGLAATYAMYVKMSKEVPAAAEVLQPKKAKTSYRGRNQELDIHDWVRIREAYNNLHKKVSLLENLYANRQTIYHNQNNL